MAICIIIVGLIVGLWAFDSLSIKEIGPYGILFSAICTFLGLWITNNHEAKQTKEQGIKANNIK